MNKSYTYTYSVLIAICALSLFVNAAEEPWYSSLYKRTKRSFNSLFATHKVWIQSQDGAFLKSVNPTIISFMHYASGDALKANKDNSQDNPLVIPLSARSLYILVGALYTFAHPSYFSSYIAGLDAKDQYRLIRAMRITNAVYVEEAAALVLKERYVELINHCLEQEPQLCSSEHAGSLMPSKN